MKKMFLFLLALLAIMFVTTLVTRPEMLVVIANVSWIAGLVVAIATAIYVIVYFVKKTTKPKWVRILASVLIAVAIAISYLTGFAGITGIIGFAVAAIITGVALFITRGK